MVLLKIKYLLSGKPSSWLPRKLKLVMHDVLRKSLRFPRVSLKKNQALFTTNFNDKLKVLAAIVLYFLVLKKKECKTTISSYLNTPNCVQTRRYLKTARIVHAHKEDERKETKILQFTVLSSTWFH
jgi:hypothetical protein